MSLTTYKLRLDNSICDVFRLRSPEGIYEVDGVTPRTQAWIDKAFPYMYGVSYCHINPNDNVDRKLYCYINVDRDTKGIGAHEIEITDFNITPKKLYDLLKNHGYKKNLSVVRLDNMEYVLPNIVKRDKILNDGQTFALIHNLDAGNFTDSMKERFKDYCYTSKGAENFTPKPLVDGKSDELGLVTGIVSSDYFPIEVTFPNGTKGKFIAEDLQLFHEV